MSTKICSNPNCRSTKTPSWRRVNGKIYCNACAIYAKRHNGEMRPIKKKKNNTTNKKKKKKSKNPNQNKKRRLTTIKTKTVKTQNRKYNEDLEEEQKLHYAGKRVPPNKKILNTRVFQQQKRENQKEKKQNLQGFHEIANENENEKEKEKEKENEQEQEQEQEQYQQLYRNQTQSQNRYDELEKKLEQKIKKKKSQTKVISRKRSPQNSSQELEEMSRSHKATLRAGDCVGMRLQDGSEIYAIIQLFLKENQGEGNSFCKVIWLIPKIQSYKTDQQEFNPMELSLTDFIVGNAEPLAQPITCITRKLNFRMDLSTLNLQKFNNK